MKGRLCGYAQEEAGVVGVFADPSSIAEHVRRMGIGSQVSVGCAWWRHERWTAEFGGDVDTLFDLASVTKPLTAVVVALGAIDRRSPLGRWIPEIKNCHGENVVMEAALSHRAGLAAHLNLYEPLRRGEPLDRSEALRRAASLRVDASRLREEEDYDPLYSDMGYLLVGEALARADAVSDVGLVIQQRLAGPLAVERELGSVRDLRALGVDVLSMVAPTEDVEWRGGIVRGEVHDENAWAFGKDGAAGHAGVFGTARGVVTFACSVLDVLSGRPTPWGTNLDFEWLIRPRAGGTLRAGFDGKSPVGSSAGSVLGERSFGHLGFTGTSVWLDPDQQVVVCFLSNRVHPTRSDERIRQVRPSVHDALARWALARRQFG